MAGSSQVSGGWVSGRGRVTIGLQPDPGVGQRIPQWPAGQPRGEDGGDIGVVHAGHCGVVREAQPELHAQRQALLRQRLRRCPDQLGVGSDHRTGCLRQLSDGAGPGAAGHGERATDTRSVAASIQAAMSRASMYCNGVPADSGAKTRPPRSSRRIRHGTRPTSSRAKDHSARASRARCPNASMRASSPRRVAAA